MTAAIPGKSGFDIRVRGHRGKSRDAEVWFHRQAGEGHTTLHSHKTEETRNEISSRGEESRYRIEEIRKEERFVLVPVCFLIMKHGASLFFPAMQQG